MATNPYDWGSLEYHLIEAVEDLRSAIGVADPLETYFPDLVDTLRMVARVCAAAGAEAAVMRPESEVGKREG